MLKEGDLVVPAWPPPPRAGRDRAIVAGIGIVVRAVAIDYGRGKVVSRYKVFWFLSQAVSLQPLKDSDLTKLVLGA